MACSAAAARGKHPWHASFFREPASIPQRQNRMWWGWTGTARPDPLVDGRDALVVQHPPAAIPRGLLGHAPFQAWWTRSPGNWLEKEALLLGLSNAVNASARI